MRRHTYEAPLIVGDLDGWGHRDCIRAGGVVHIEARTSRGLRRKVKRLQAQLKTATTPMPQYDYAQHAHEPMQHWDVENAWPGQAALDIARKRARMKLGLSRRDGNLLVALDEADRRGWL